MELQAALEGRYSCRQFADKAPAKEQITQILEAGRLAPTACNNQPQRLYVVTDPQVLDAMDEVTHCRYNAPCMIVVGYETSEAMTHGKIFPDEDWSFGDLDATSVLMQMLLKAHEIGLETCWLGAFGEAKCREVVGIPESVAVRAIIDLGYPGEKGIPGPKHTDRKPLEETVTWI